MENDVKQAFLTGCRGSVCHVLSSLTAWSFCVRVCVLCKIGSSMNPD